MVASYKATDDGRLQMIRVERHEEVRPGISRYTVPGFARRSATARACFRAPMAVAQRHAASAIFCAAYEAEVGGDVTKLERVALDGATSIIVTGLGLDRSPEWDTRRSRIRPARSCRNCGRPRSLRSRRERPRAKKRRSPYSRPQSQPTPPLPCETLPVLLCIMRNRLNVRRAVLLLKKGRRGNPTAFS